MKLHALVQVTRQTGPDTWEPVTFVIDLTPDTTIGEVQRWAADKLRLPVNRPAYMSVQIVGEREEDER